MLPCERGSRACACAWRMTGERVEVVPYGRKGSMALVSGRRAPYATGVMSRVSFTCPACGKSQTVEVPKEACLALHRCTACGAVVRPLPGDCCVICSYSAERCPVSLRAVAA